MRFVLLDMSSLWSAGLHLGTQHTPTFITNYWWKAFRTPCGFLEK